MIRLHWTIWVALASWLVTAAVYYSIPAHATPDNDDLAVEAAFCHDIRIQPTTTGVQQAALQMIRIYGNPDTAADIAMQAVTYICPDLRAVLLMAVNSPDWTGVGRTAV